MIFVNPSSGGEKGRSLPQNHASQDPVAYGFIQMEKVMLDAPPSPSVVAESSHELTHLVTKTEIEPSLSNESLWRLIKSDFQTARVKDPLQGKWLQLLFCSVGLHAIILHRFAHRLHNWNIPLMPRLLSQFARFITGIEIHPGAQLGKGVFVIHGMGVVIGETAIIGEGTLIYEGVTLGGTGKQTGKRHPTLGQNVIVGSGAKVLGNISIGNGVRIAAGAIVLRNAPDRSIVVGIPGRIIYEHNENEPSLDTDWQPDIEAQVLQKLFERIKCVETEINSLKQAIATSTSETVLDLTPAENSDYLIESFLDGAGI